MTFRNRIQVTGIALLVVAAASGCSGSSPSAEASGGSAGSAGSGAGGADSGSGGTGGFNATGGASGATGSGGSGIGGSSATGGSAGSAGSAGSGGSASGQGLLSGCSVGPNGQPSCATPSGWTLVVADGFEGGQLVDSSKEELHGATVDCSFAHTGSCALGAEYTSNGNSYRWILKPGAIGNSHEVYVSWWEYLDSGARLNGEMFLVAALNSSQSDILDWWDSPDNCLNGEGPGPSYNCENAQIVISPQSNTQGGVNNAYYVDYLDADLGSWRQYEYHFKANTPGSADGQAELYVDGKLFGSWTNKNFNANISMNGMEVDVGGVYTAGATTDSTGTVCKLTGSTSYVHWCSPFSACAPCPIPPDFHRYWDDVIVLKK